MSSSLHGLVNKNNQNTDIVDEIDAGEVLPQYELKNEEFEVENMRSLSNKDLSKSSKSDFAVINNDLPCEINIFGLKEVINLAESSDLITNKLCMKYDVPFLALKNIVEMKKKEVFSKEKTEIPNSNEDTALRNKQIQEIKEDFFNIYKSHNLHNLVELSGVDIYMGKKQQSEKVFNTYTNLENTNSLNYKPILNTNNDNNPLSINRMTDSKIKELDTHTNLFTIDNLYELNKKENNKKGVLSKNSGTSSKRPFDKNKNNKTVESKKNFNNKNVSQSVSSINSNTSTLSDKNFIGERLYRKSIALASEKKRQTEKAKLQDEINKKQECSFNPKINSINSIFGSEIKPKLYEKKSEKIVIPDENLEFQSKKINISQEEAEKLFSKLYREKETRDQQKTLLQNEYFSQFKFSPEINEKSKPVLQNFYKRLQDWIQKKTEKEREDFEKSRFDSKTGQELFHPVISQRSKEIEKKDIWETLYREKNYFLAMKKENMTIQEKEFINSNKIKLVSDNSEQIINQLKNSIFVKLFLSLDTDNDKMISFNDFNTNNLPSDVLNILKGISLNIKDNNMQLTEEEFIKSMEQIDQALNYSEKSNIFLWFNNTKLHTSVNCCVNENNLEKFPFQPEPSKKSTDLFNKSTKNNKNFLVRNNETVKSKENFIISKKTEFEAEEMKECTFSPNINKRQFNTNTSQNLAQLGKKNTANTGTIVSKMTNANTYRTDDQKNQNDDTKPNFKTININELNEGVQNNDNQSNLRIEEGESERMKENEPKKSERN